jgi:FkbM family methyltransferase
MANMNYIPQIIFSIKNWVVFCLSYAGIVNTKNNTYFLRNGVKIETKEPVDVSTIAVVFIKKNYGRIPGDSVIVDIGANIGVFAIYAASTAKNSTIYAYEPEKSNYELLRRNIKANNLEETIRPYNLGVSAEKEKRKLFLNDSLSHSICSQKNETPWVEIDCVPLEYVFESNSLDHIDLLKIDCEGAEFEILYSNSSEYLNRIREIRMEYHNRDSKNDIGELIKFLEEKGKDVVLLRPHDDYSGTLWLS